MIIIADMDVSLRLISWPTLQLYLFCLRYVMEARCRFPEEWRSQASRVVFCSCGSTAGEHIYHILLY